MNIMRSKVLVLSVIAAAAALFQSAPAHALIGLGVVGGGGYTVYGASLTEQNISLEVKGGVAYSLGVSAELGPLEGDILYTRRTIKTVADISGNSTTESSSYNSMDIPVFFTLGIYPVAVGVGGFVSRSMDQDVEDNYGLAAKVKVKVPLAGVFGDLRYMQGLKKDDAGKRTSTVMLLVGFNIL